MSRWADVVLGGAVFTVLAAAVAACVRSVREVLAVEKERRRRIPLVTAPKIVEGGQSASLPPAPPFDVADSYLDDEIAQTARRIIDAQGLTR